MIELRDDQLQALDTEKQPVAAVDPRTGQVYRLIKQEVYDLVCGTLKPYGRGWDDDPEMDVYEQFREEAMNRGEVVLVDWQYSDLSGSKLRPAVGVMSDAIMRQIEDCLKTVLALP